jgi:hypothetical protein
MLPFPRFLLDGMPTTSVGRRPHNWCSKTMNHRPHSLMCLDRRINHPYFRPQKVSGSELLLRARICRSKRNALPSADLTFVGYGRVEIWLSKPKLLEGFGSHIFRSLPSPLHDRTHVAQQRRLSHIFFCIVGRIAKARVRN